MKNDGWFTRLLTQHSAAGRIVRATGVLAAAAVIAAAGSAIAQDPNSAAPAPEPRITAPEGYTLHHSIDMGGRVSNQVGSGAMYDTLVNLQSGPRVQGETFELHAIPREGRISLVDNLSAFSSGFGGDPYTFTKLDMTKGKAYEFSGIFRRDRQYMDYNLLGNPNIAGGFSIPVGGSTTPYAWQQLSDSPFLFNTVRRMTDTSLTLFPLSTWTFHVAYSRGIFEGPSLTPSGNAVAGQEILLEEFQRNNTDDFTAAADWKPVRNTKLTFEEQIDHYKNDSSFSLAPQFFTVQESDGTKAQLLASYTAGANSMPYGYNSLGYFVPYGTGKSGTATASSGFCNASMVNPSQILSANPNGGLPIIDPACNVITNYVRTAPTRVIFPTETFRLQSSSIKHITMNGNVRYTNANMNLANYYDSFQGLQGATRQLTFAGYANAKRQVMAADYGIVWQVASKVSLAEQVSFSNAHQPGLAGMLSETTTSVPTTAGQETINYTPNAPVNVTTGSPVTGGPALGGTQAGYFGQRFAINTFTVSWDATPRTTYSIAWRYQDHLISEGQGTQAHNILIPANNTTNGEVTIHENGGVFNAALHPTTNWDLNGSLEAAYNDSVFTPMGFRQLRHYRVHTIYRVKPWATVTGAFNDLERHNNTNNNQNVAGNTTAYYGPLNHVDHARIVSLGTEMFPNERYGLDLDYSYNDVYTSENICFQGSATVLPGGAIAPGAATQSGVLCGGVTAGHGANNVLYLGRQFADAPTQFGSAALALSPNTKLRYNIGYRVSAVSGSRSFSDARDVNGSMVSKYQTPFVNVAWTMHPGLIWKGEYNYYGYGEGGPSGAQYCNTNASLAVGTPSAPGVLCNSVPLTAVNGAAYGATTPRNFHANNVLLGVHYEF